MPKLRFVKLIGPKAVIFTAILLAFMVGTAWAVVMNRPNPLMDYAPQETGIYDTYYDNLAETDCRFCHGASTSDRHHFTTWAIQKDCLHCHPPFDEGEGTEVPRETNCRSAGGPGYTCHADFSNGWHHMTSLAETHQCTACHSGNWLGDYSETVLSFEAYPPYGGVAPTPYSCENCHWSEGLSDNHPSTDVHYDPWYMTVANFKCLAGDDPQFTTSNDAWKMHAGDDGYLYSMPILNNQDTHHMGDLGPVKQACEWCHACDLENGHWDPTNPELIRYCEKCHSIASLHRIPGHVSNSEFPYGSDFSLGGNNAKAWEAAETSGDGEGYATLYKAYDVNQRCIGCHGDYIAGAPVPYSQEPPVVDSILPNAGQVGTLVQLRGSHFGDELMDGDIVEIRPTDNSLPWTRVPVSDWGDARIIWYLPAWLVPEGNYKVRVSVIVWTDDNHNGSVDPGELSTKVAANKPVFTIVNGPHLTDIVTSADLIPVGEPPVMMLNWIGPGGGAVDADLYTYGPYYSVLKLNSQDGGFGSNYKHPIGNPTTPRAKVYSSVMLMAVENSPPGGGFAGAYVVPVGENIEGINRQSVIKWKDKNIIVRLKNLWRDNNGNGFYEAGIDNLMNPQDIHPGSYYVRVRSVFYVDWNGNSKPTQTDPDAEPGSAENEIVTTCVTDPGTLNLTNTPFILKPNPKYVPRSSGLFVRLIGINFGDYIYDSKVTIYNGKATIVKRVYTIAQMGTKIRRWTPTKVVIKLPPADSPVGAKRKISVTVGGVESNKVLVRIVN